MVVAAIAAFVGAALQSSVGFGFALILSPAVFAAFEPAEALTALFVLGGALCALVLFAERRPRRVRGDRLVGVMLWTVPGMVVGVLILLALDKPTLQIAVGLAVIVAVVVQSLVRPGASGASVPEPAWAAPVVGLTTGVLNNTTGTSGPPLVLWFQHLEFTPAEFRDSLAAAFLALDAVGIIVLAIFGDGLEGIGALELAALLALTVAGQLAGRQLFERIEPHVFRLAGVALVLLAGVASVAAGVAAG